MLDVIKPHHVSLCVLLRAFLDSEVLQVRSSSWVFSSALQVLVTRKAAKFVGHGDH